MAVAPMTTSRPTSIASTLSRKIVHKTARAGRTEIGEPGGHGPLDQGPGDRARRREHPAANAARARPGVPPSACLRARDSPAAHTSAVAMARAASTAPT
jgi:hypothetical protein